MSDVFISYAREDRARVKDLAAMLEQHGWSVWWDREIVAGQDFEKTIAAALQGARCVVVVWSRAALDSSWVKDEADEGLRRNALIPVRIDDVAPPFGFRRRQTVDLVGWDGASLHPEFESLVTAIKALAPETVPLALAEAAKRPPSHSWLASMGLVLRQVPVLIRAIIFGVILVAVVALALTLTGPSAGERPAAPPEPTVRW